MKIAFASDIHLEFGRGQFILPDADMLLLAGDIFVPNIVHNVSRFGKELKLRKRFDKFFAECSAKYKNTFIILGNHEFYHGDFNTTPDIVRKMLPHNVVLLDGEAAVMDGIAIFGSTFWTDMNNKHPADMWDANRGMNDFRIITNLSDSAPYSGTATLRAADVAIVNELHRKRLQTFLDLHEDKFTIVMTHHAPDTACSGDKHRNSNLWAAYCNTKIFSIDSEFTKFPNVWLHGHLHDGKQSHMLGDTLVISNCRGYMNYEPGVKHWSIKTLEIDL